MGAAVDNVAVIGIVSMVFTSGSMDLTVLPVAHLVLSFSRALMVLVCVLCPQRIAYVRALEMSYYFTITSAALLIGCASALFLESASPQPDILGRLALDDQEEYDKMAALTSYSMVNAMVSCSLFVSRRFRNARHDSESAPADVHRLKDVTLHTLVIDGLEGTSKNVSDSSDRESCCICLCPFLAGEVVNELTCRHRYHKSCLEDWDASRRNQGKAMSCPLRCEMRSVAELINSPLPETQSRSSSTIFV
eukprot:TRINITY_DN40906_c0_g1_i1.p1 TRINITY_DN40906_c0_g1~~TRINITY_DN40906_c0_g1_i1.p1  ORF type:complete len:289 (+),score=26.06 TRINITY_DN40906_c0_g1_i1:123-869(+)